MYENFFDFMANLAYEKQRRDNFRYHFTAFHCGFRKAKSIAHSWEHWFHMLVYDVRGNKFWTGLFLLSTGLYRF